MAVRSLGWRLMAPTVVLLIVAAACQPTATTPAPTAAPAASNLILAADLVQGSKNIPEAERATQACVLTNRFPRNSEMVWRARVYDPTTGTTMDGQEVSRVEIRLANGQTVPMRFAPHPQDPPGEAYWTGSWLVPKDAPTGTLNYTIVATDAMGRTGEWKPFSVAPSLPTITDEVYPDAPAKA